MAFIDMQKCLRDASFQNSRFIMATVAAKRANDLALGNDLPMLEPLYTKFATIAMEEIGQGLLHAEAYKPS